MTKDEAKRVSIRFHRAMARIFAGVATEKRHLATFARIRKKYDEAILSAPPGERARLWDIGRNAYAEEMASIKEKAAQ